MDQIHKLKTEEKQFEHAYLIQVKMGILFLKYLKTHPEYSQFASSNPTEGMNLLFCSVFPNVSHVLRWFLDEMATYALGIRCGEKPSQYFVAWAE